MQHDSECERIFSDPYYREQTVATLSKFGFKNAERLSAHELCEKIGQQTDPNHTPTPCYVLTHKYGQCASMGKCHSKKQYDELYSLYDGEHCYLSPAYLRKMQYKCTTLPKEILYSILDDIHYQYIQNPLMRASTQPNFQRTIIKSEGKVMHERLQVLTRSLKSPVICALIQDSLVEEKSTAAQMEFQLRNLCTLLEIKSRGLFKDIVSVWSTLKAWTDNWAIWWDLFPCIPRALNIIVTQDDMLASLMKEYYGAGFRKPLTDVIGREESYLNWLNLST